MRMANYVVAFCVLFLSPTVALSAYTIGVQGMVRSAAGLPVVEGKYTLTYSLYATQDSDKVLHKEIHPGITITNGIISAHLGEKETLDPSIFTADSPLWLGIAIDDEPELSRAKLQHVPYAMSSNTALAISCDGCITSKHLGADVLSNHVTKAQLADSLVAYVTQEDLSKTLNDFVTQNALEEALNNNANSDEVAQAIATALKDYSTTAQMAQAIDSGLKDYATKNEVTQAIVTALKAYPTQSDVTQFITVALKDNATQADVAQAIAAALKDNATQSDVAKALSDYVNQSTLAAALAPYATTASVQAALKDYLPLVGGTLTGTLVANKGLNLKGSTLSGAQFEVIDVNKVTCVDTLLGRTVINTKDSTLYYCNGNEWRRLTGCSTQCPASNSQSCGAILSNGCGDVCPAKGTGLNAAQCPAQDKALCGADRKDECGNLCPGGTGTALNTAQCAAVNQTLCGNQPTDNCNNACPGGTGTALNTSQCKAPAQVQCGTQPVDGCNNNCPGSAGTALNTAQCKSPGTVDCGTSITDQCNNSCPDSTGTQCPSGQVCNSGDCIADQVTKGYVTIENTSSCAGDNIDDDWYDCNKDPSNSNCNPLGTKVQGESVCTAYFNGGAGDALAACKCIFGADITQAKNTNKKSSTGCDIFECIK